MANNQAVAAARDLVTPKSTAAIDGVQLLAIALFAGEDALRRVMQKRPYVVIAGSLALGAVVGVWTGYNRFVKTSLRET